MVYLTQKLLKTCTLILISMHTCAPLELKERNISAYNFHLKLIISPSAAEMSCICIHWHEILSIYSGPMQSLDAKR